jgi:NAD(P)-dependent dehydrogenase (short-subunit alcohol dehydrogenase family)
MINPMELTGKHILITGGSSGIGRECAIQASRLGARVTLIARSRDNLMETIEAMENSEKHACYDFDLSKTNEIETLIKTVVVRQGRVDGFCHAAGIGDLRPLKQCKPAFVEKMLRIHIYAFVELIRALSLKDYLRDGASLVGISSVAAERGNLAQGVYAAAKAGINGFLQPAARELAPRGIRVNAVSYAMVDTDMFRQLVNTEEKAELIERQFYGVIDVESAANAVMFLLSNACKYITGSVFPVYAGY